MTDDQSRPVATSDDNAYTLTVHEAAELYNKSGHARTPRAIQRYCKNGDLQSIRSQTFFGITYRITPESVARHIMQISEVLAATDDATGRDQARPVATDVALENKVEVQAEPPATTHDQSRLVATSDDTDRYVAHLEEENKFLRNQVSVKDFQIETSNKQIASLTERIGESNRLTLGFQQLLGLQPRSTNEPNVSPANTEIPAQPVQSGS